MTTPHNVCAVHGGEGGRGGGGRGEGGEGVCSTSRDVQYTGTDIISTVGRMS